MIGHNRTVVGAARTVDQSLANRYGSADDSTLWDIYESLGPVHYGLGFKRNAASRVRYYPAEIIDGEMVETDDPQVVDAFDRITNINEIVGDFMVHINVPGEGWLVGIEKDDVETWEVWSSEEINQKKKELEGQVAVRVWRPSPRKRSKADSPLRSVQPQCEQLLLLNDQIGATAMSRLPAGLLKIPDEITFAAPADENSEESSFEDDLMYVISTAVKDPKSASRVTPVTVRGPAEYLDKIGIVDFSRDMDVTFANMREELLRQIAAGLDLPGEILTGLADLNHWSLWGIEESTLKHHIDPDILLILSGLTEQYLWPALEMEDKTRFVLWRDYQDLTSRPVSPDQAQALYRDGVINANELRMILNLAKPDQADVEPSDIAQRAETVGILFRAGFEPEAILAALGVPPIEHTGVAPVTVQSEDAVEDLPPSDRSVPVTAAAGVQLDGLADIDQALATQIIEATEAAFQRSLERAGVRIRNKVRKDRDLTALIDGVANTEVTRTLGPAQLERYQLTQDQLLPADEFDALRKRLARLLDSAYVETEEELTIASLPPADYPDVVVDKENAIDNFIAALFAIAAVRLFTDGQPPESGEVSDTIASGQMVFDLMGEAAGGGRGYALGERTRAALVDAGYVTTSETWRYGFAPRQAFPGHRALDGAQFTDPESPKLRVPSEYAWVGVSYFFPGDHKGCLCQTVPTVLPALDL